jgi:prevent-host-death family protein
MKIVSVSELKAHLAKYLRLVRRGGEVQVSERGIPIARLIPIGDSALEEDDATRLARLVQSGVVRLPEKGGDAAWVLERPPLATTASVSEALETDRNERV